MASLLGTMRVRLGLESEEFKRGMNRARKQTQSFSREINKLRGNALAQVASFGAVTLAIKRSLDTANAFDAAQRALAASAKLTGISLSSLEGISEKVQAQFHVSASTANELTVTMSKLAKQAGQTAQTGKALNAVLDLGAARGMSASQTLESLKMVLVGTDNGFDRLIGLNMSQIWKDWAKAEGVAVGKMTDMQKQLAVMTEIMKDGETVRGSYREFLKSAAGQQELLSQGILQTEAAFGHALQPALVAIIPAFVSLADWLTNSVKWVETFGATMALIPGAVEAAKVGLTQGLTRSHQVWEDYKTGVLAEIDEIWNGTKRLANVPSLPTPKPSPTNTNDKERENILLQDAIERTKILAGVEETRLGSTAKISDKLRIELALEDQLFTIKKNSLNADKTLSDQKRKNELLSLQLGHEREVMQLKLNAAAQQEADILETTLRHRQQLKQTVEQQVAGIAGSALSGGGVSGSQIGSSIGTIAEVALPHIPVVSELLPAVGGFIGGLFDKDKPKPQPIVKGLDAIERAQRDTISTIKASTDKLLSPQDRFLNLPSSFNVPDFRPSVGSSVSQDMSVTININGATADPTDISREVERVMGEVLFEQRRTMAWGVLS